MPLRHRLCWCLTGRKPEISYNAADNGGLQLVPLDMAEPMPTDSAELDAKFAELVVSSSTGTRWVVLINRHAVFISRNKAYKTVKTAQSQYCGGLAEELSLTGVGRSRRNWKSSSTQRDRRWSLSQAFKSVFGLVQSLRSLDSQSRTFNAIAPWTTVVNRHQNRLFKALPQSGALRDDAVHLLVCLFVCSSVATLGQPPRVSHMFRPPWKTYARPWNLWLRRGLLVYSFSKYHVYKFGSRRTSGRTG